MCAKLPPKCGAVAASGQPLSLEPRQIVLERALAQPEDVAALAAKDLPHQPTTMAGPADDVLDRDVVLGQREDRGIGVLTPEVALISKAFGGA